MTPPGRQRRTLPIPTARDIRVRLQPLTAERANYYGTDSPPVGPFSDYIMRKEATSEAALFRGQPGNRSSAPDFQPGSNMPQLLAQSLGLAQNGADAFPASRASAPCSAPPARCAARSRATAARSRFANQTELLGHWIVALSLELERDWTWDGFAAPAHDRLGATADGDRHVSPSPHGRRRRDHRAADDRDQHARRSRRAGGPLGTRLVFLDAINPNPAPGASPRC